jgi:cytochrome b561
MSDAHYTRTAVSLHWLVGALMIAAIFMGWTMTEMAISPQKLKLYNYHKWVGITVLALAALRIYWRLTHRPPPLAAMPAWQSRAARSMYVVMYILMLALPLSGWAYSNAVGFPVVYLGKIPLPDLVGKDKVLGANLHELHEILGTVLAGLIALHILAALKHHFVNRDATLKHMLRWRS